MGTQLETNVVSVERIIEYSRTSPEVCWAFITMLLFSLISAIMYWHVHRQKHTHTYTSTEKNKYRWKHTNRHKQTHKKHKETHTYTQADRHQGKIEVPVSWPTRGHLEFKGYGLRYRPNLDLVLKNINLSFRPGEKVFDWEFVYNILKLCIL